jgi:hypothetical protein
MSKLQINTIMNSNLSGIHNYSGIVFNKIPQNVEYVGPYIDWGGITVFTDECFDDQHLHIIDKVNSKIKLGWMHEPKPLHDIQQNRYKKLEENINKFDYILTYDNELLTKYPNKTIYTVDNAIWLDQKFNKIHPKNKLVSMIFSWKNWTEGHRLRHLIAKNVEGVSLYGTGAGKEIQGKEEGLVDYKYSIVIENSNSPFYFTEKILDCLACGTIPIYWGCSNIGEFFNKKGIMQFSQIEDLEDIFTTLSEHNHYEKTLPYIEENFQKVLEYNIYEDWMYNNVYKKILN